MRGCDPRGGEGGAFGAIDDALAGECDGLKRERDGLWRGRAAGSEGNVRRSCARGFVCWRARLHHVFRSPVAAGPLGTARTSLFYSF